MYCDNTTETRNVTGIGGESLVFEIWTIFAISFAASALFGNILFLASVIYAKTKKRHGFDSPEWISSTVFLLNLAFVDILYLLFHFANGFIGFLKVKYGLNGLCKFLVLCRLNLSIIDGWSTAAFAFNAAFPKIR